MQLCSVIPASFSFTKLYITIVLCHVFLCYLPTTTSAEEGKPTFTEEPVDSLNIIKSATLKCNVKSALNAWFECSEDETNMQRKQSGSNYVDPSDGVRHIELQLELFRRNKEFSSPFQCWCNAYGAHQTVESRRANLQFTASMMEPEEAEVEQPKPVDGGWSPWSTWSACSHECQQVRRRYCTHPSPKYGGQHCFGSDTHIRNCTGGLCRKLDMYQQKREKDGDSSSKSGRSSSPRDLYLFAIIATATFLFLLVLFVLLIFRRRSRQTKHETGYITTRGEGGHGIHLLLQQQQQQQQAGMGAMQPDLIRGGSGGGDKMQLISRLNNFDSNVLEHLVIRNERSLQSASPHHFSQQQHQLPYNNTAEVKGVPASINLTCANLSSSNNNHVMTGSMNSVVTTPMHRHAIVHSSNTEASSDAGSSDGDHSEPDYAEPMITPSPAAFTPDRKPPLPRSCPPNRQNAAHPDPTRRMLQQQQQQPSHQGSRRKNRSSANRPSTRNPRYKNIESSSNSS